MSRVAIKFIPIFLIIFTVSCDLFRTRTPAEPSEKSSNFVPLTEPDLVFNNLITSFKDGNAVNYMKSFSDVFLFEASINARNIYGTELTNWDKEKEQNYFNKIKSRLQKNSFVTLTFTNKTSTVSSDNYDVTTEYRINVPHTVVGVSTVFRGQAQFQLVRDPKSGEWSIQKWIDSDIGMTASDSTWSDLKGKSLQW